MNSNNEHPTDRPGPLGNGVAETPANFPSHRAQIKAALRAPETADQVRAVLLDRLAGKIDHYHSVRTSTSTKFLKNILARDGYLRLATVPANSRLVTVHYGSSDSQNREETGIKALNDKFLGMVGAEVSIQHRQHTLTGTYANYGIADRDNEIVHKFRTDLFWLDANQVALALNPSTQAPVLSSRPPQSVSEHPPTAGEHLNVLDSVTRSVEKSVQSALRQQVLAKRAEVDEDLSTHDILPGDFDVANDSDPLEVVKLKRKRAALTSWLDSHQEANLILTFGISDVIRSVDSIEERLVEEAKTLMGARMVEYRSRSLQRASVRPEQREKRGGAFDLAATVVDMLYEKTQIETLSPTKRELYFDKEDQQGVTRWKLKERVINALRKKKLETLLPDDNDRFFIERYYGKLLRFDVIRPWPDLKAWGKHIAQVKHTLEHGEIEELRTAALTHYKPTGDMTEGQFHAEASSYKKGVYLALDAIGMGVENVQSFQRVFWNILNRLEREKIVLPNQYHSLKDFFTENQNTSKLVQKIVEEEMLTSGNEVTKAYYEKIAIIRKHVAAYQLATEKPNPVISSSHNGDEYFVFIPLEETPTWHQGDNIHRSDNPFLVMLANIYRDTGMRISGAYKDLDMGHQGQKSKEHSLNISEHQACLEELESGLQAAKAYEVLQAQLQSDQIAKPGLVVLQNSEYKFSTVLFDGDQIYVAKSAVIEPIATTLAKDVDSSEASLVKRIIKHVKISPERNTTV